MIWWNEWVSTCAKSCTTIESFLLWEEMMRSKKWGQKWMNEKRVEIRVVVIREKLKIFSRYINRIQSSSTRLKNTLTDMDVTCCSSRCRPKVVCPLSTPPSHSWESSGHRKRVESERGQPWNVGPLQLLFPSFWALYYPRFVSCLKSIQVCASSLQVFFLDSFFLCPTISYYYSEVKSHSVNEKGETGEEYM